MEHVDQITGKLRANELAYYTGNTADGIIYTRGELAVTRLTQNPLAQYLTDAGLADLLGAAQIDLSQTVADQYFNHDDTVVVELDGLCLTQDKGRGMSGMAGSFFINPYRTRNLNSQQAILARRAFGPDEESFGLNMGMFAERGTGMFISFLIPEFVEGTLQRSGKNYLARSVYFNCINSSAFSSLLDLGVLPRKHW